MNPERYPWDRLGPGAEPELAPDFANRVIQRARIERQRAKQRRRIGAGAICGVVVVGLAIFATRRPQSRPAAVIASAPHSAMRAIAPANRAAAQSAAPALDVASAYGIANASDAGIADYEQVAGAQSAVAAQDQGDVFSAFLPGADDVAAFESSYATTENSDWAQDPAWDSNS